MKPTLQADCEGTLRFEGTRGRAIGRAAGFDTKGRDR